MPKTTDPSLAEFVPFEARANLAELVSVASLPADCSLAHASKTKISLAHSAKSIPVEPSPAELRQAESSRA